MSEPQVNGGNLDNDKDVLDVINRVLAAMPYSARNAYLQGHIAELEELRLDLPNRHYGMPHEQIDGATDIPPIPEVFKVPGAPDESIQALGDPRYGQVDFHGNYGFLCGQYQEFTRYNVTESQIRQIGWAAFGNCGWDADRS